MPRRPPRCTGEVATETGLPGGLESRFSGQGEGGWCFQSCLKLEASLRDLPSAQRQGCPEATFPELGGGSQAKLWTMRSSTSRRSQRESGSGSGARADLTTRRPGGGRVSGSPLKIFGLQRDHELRVYLEKRRSRACWLETHARRAEQSLGHACLWITSAPKGAASARGGACPAGFTVRPSPGAEQSGARSPGLGLHCARRLSCLPGKATAWDSRVPSTCCKDPARQCSPPRRS